MRTSPRGALSRKLALLALAILTALLAAACGASHTSSSKTRSVSLVLDFTPNAVHTGIYTAIARGYDRAAGIDLHVIVPGASTDAIKLLETGRADFAILDIHDLAIAREHGQSIAGILPIVQQPLAAVIAAAKFHDPKQLQGQTVGVSGAPSDLAVLNSVVAGSGGDPAKVKTITIGFNAVADLLAGRVAAATAFWNDEGVTLQRRQPGFHVFRVDAYGAPSYPELVVCASDAFLHAHPDLARDLVADLDARLRRRDPEPAGRSARARVTGPGARSDAGRGRAGEARARVHRSRAPVRRARPSAAAPLGGVGTPLRDRHPHAGRRDHVRYAVRAALRRLGISRYGTSWSTSSPAARAIRERGTTRSNPAERAASRTSASTCEKNASVRRPSGARDSADCAAAIRAVASSVRSITSIWVSCRSVSSRLLTSRTSWPAARNAPRTFDPNSRSGTKATTRATQPIKAR